jgi:hypothetical protein
MTTKLSTGLINAMAEHSSVKDALAGCVFDIYSGAQPANADAAKAGTLLATLTESSGAYTAETKAVGAFTITGAGGSLNTLTVNGVDILGGAVAFDTDVTTTAAAVVAQINNNPKNRLFVASNVLGVVSLTAVSGLGALVNTWVVAGSVTTLSITTPATTPMTGGVDAVNGLTFGGATAGVIAKAVAEIWSATAVASGTAGWFRIRGFGDDGTAASTTAVRLDGSIATSGGDVNIGSLTVTVSAPFLLSAFTVAVPAA